MAAIGGVVMLDVLQSLQDQGFVVSCAVASLAAPANMNNAMSPVTILRFIISLRER